MARPASLAEHYRAHRAAFTLALELGCTPKEAAAELRLREARAATREWLRKEAERARCGTVIPARLAAPPAGHDWANPREERDAQPWMMRD